MKHQILKMVAVLAVCLLTTVTGISQSLVYPTKADNPWYSAAALGTPGYIAGFNTAQIQLLGWGINGLPTTLMVSDYYGNGTPGGVVFTDQSSLFQVQLTYHTAGPLLNYYIGGSPDITVGNFITPPPVTNNQIMVAVAYINVDLITGLRNPQIDYFMVTYTGPGVFTVSYVSTTVITGVSEPNVIHIDVAAEATNTATTGLPWCSQFIFTWDDLGTGSGGAVFANTLSFNAPLPVAVAEGASQLINAQGMAPDVAAIQRSVVSCVGCPPTVDYYGLIVYTDPTQTVLRESEWDASLPIPSFIPPTPPLDVVGFPDYFVFPRIDAIDDYTTNNTPGTSYYKAVAEKHLGPNIYAWSYCNLTGFGGFNNSWFFAPTDYEYAPTVAWGPNNTQYAIAHSSTDAPTGPPLYPTWNTFMEPIDWTAPGTIVNPPNDYYLVNFNPFSPTNFVNGNWLTSISTPCNNTSLETLVAWSLFDKSTNVSTVFYKNTPYTAVAPNYHFRQSNTATAAVTEWKVYPNPTTGVLVIDNPLAADAHYEVADMAGRTVLSGTLAPGAHDVDVSALVAGSYIINLYKGDKLNYNTKFVKQ